MKINYKKLIKIILITFLIGNLFTIFTFNSNFYKDLNKPFNIPQIIFPIIWSILFILMSISYYIISIKNNSLTSKILYFTQLIVNAFWPLIFFGFKKYFFGFIWILLLILLVILMIINFYKIDKKAGLLQIFYLLWLIFAGYLNYMIYYLN